MSSWKVYKDVDKYFVTTSIAGWMPVFIDKIFFSIITESLKYCVENKSLTIHAYVIMPNHIHLFVDGGGNLSNIMRDFKTYTSRELSKLLQRKGYHHWISIFASAARESKKNDDYKVWQDDFHPVAVYSEKFYDQKLNYIHQNPVKKGYVTEPEHWYYSSARNYAGIKNCPLEVAIL